MCVGANGLQAAAGALARETRVQSALSPLSSSLHEAVALLFFFSFSIEPRVKRNTRRKDSFFHSRIRFKYIYRKKRENVYEGYLDSVEGSLEKGGGGMEDSGQQNCSPTLAFRSLALPTRMWQSSKALRATRTVILLA